MSRLLIVEDEAHIASGLRYNLEADGHDIILTETGEAALDAVAANPSKIDLVVLDVMLPGMDGFTVASRMRGHGWLTPILMLTARGRAEDVLRGFEAGADDYLPKPFEPRELVARLQAVLRRGAALKETADPIRVGPLEVNWDAHTAHLDGRPLDLTVAEFTLLGLFVRNRRSALTRERILEATRGLDWEAFDRSIDVLVSRLRQKLGDDPRNPTFIKTVRGLGYRFIGGGDD